MARKKGLRSSWIVRMRCVVIKDIVCDDCTEQQAHDDPLAFAEDEGLEQEMVDWEVESVTENL